jgi:hypothetical protein
MDDRLRVEEDKFQLQGSLEPSVGRMYMRACFSEHICLRGGTSCDTPLSLPFTKTTKGATFQIPEIYY